MVAEWLKSSPRTQQDSIWEQVHTLAALLPIQIPACGWEGTEGNPKPWDHAPTWDTQKFLAPANPNTWGKGRTCCKALLL